MTKEERKEFQTFMKHIDNPSLYTLIMQGWAKRARYLYPKPKWRFARKNKLTTFPASFT